jgi:hypothetical protein
LPLIASNCRCEWPRLKREIVEVHKWAAQHGAPAHDGRNLRRYTLGAGSHTYHAGEFSHPNLVAVSYLTTLADHDFGGDGEEEMEEDDEEDEEYPYYDDD